MKIKISGIVCLTLLLTVLITGCGLNHERLVVISSLPTESVSESSISVVTSDISSVDASSVPSSKANEDSSSPKTSSKASAESVDEIQQLLLEKKENLRKLESEYKLSKELYEREISNLTKELKLKDEERELIQKEYDKLKATIKELLELAGGVDGELPVLDELNGKLEQKEKELETINRSISEILERKEKKETQRNDYEMNYLRQSEALKNEIASLSGK